MKEDKATHVLVPIEWIENKIKYANDRIGWSKNSRIKACYMQEKLLLETLSKEFEPINPTTQQEYIKSLEDALNKIANWKLPPPDKDGYSFETNYGSNGVRDYIKSIAKQALSK